MTVSRHISHLTMKKKARKTPTVRIILLYSFVISFLFIGTIFVYQYGQYRTLEKRLTDAYKAQQLGSEDLNYLFSTYSEAENMFRLYTLDFSDSSYYAYLDKLNLLKSFVDSLKFPFAHSPQNNPALKVLDQQKIALEFAALKMRLDHLVIHTSDSLGLLTSNISLSPPHTPEIESVVNHVLKDTTKKITADTIVRKRRGLLKRIFDPKDDTIVLTREYNRLDVERVTELKKSLSSVQMGIEQSYINTIDKLQSTFLKLRGKERELVTTNFDLLNELKKSMEIIKTLDVYALRKAEENNFSLYRKNIDVFGKQLIFALALMLVMIAALVYYQLYATSYERRLHVEKDYAAKLVEEKTSVLANISHEIRTPLNSLLGVVDLLKNRTKSDNIDRKLIDSAYYSINIVSNNIADILSLSKLEASNKGNISMEYFSPNRIFLELVTLHKNQAELKGLQLETAIDIDPRFSLLNNEFRVKQVASNFLSNAIKYTQKGKITFRASLSTANDGQRLYMEVEDTGIGITEPDQHQVFRKYFTTNANAGGIGLGLYISKIMIEEIGGNIGIKSKSTVGSIFFAEIPFSDSRMETHEHRKATLSDLPPHLRLLVVDDNPINILLMKQFFKGMEHIYTVNNGEDALVLMDERPFDLVITDIHMPGISGIQLLEKIKTDERFKSIKVVAISADISTLKYAEEAQVEASFDGFIEKPFTEAEIVKTILKALS